MYGSYEGEHFTSVHLTEKGCALAAVMDVLDFLGIDDEQSALSVMNGTDYTYSETDGEQKEPFEWDLTKLKAMSRAEIWKVFSEWSERTWDYQSDRSYYIDAAPQMIQA